jgi:hypothetical protein
VRLFLNPGLSGTRQNHALSTILKSMINGKKCQLLKENIQGDSLSPIKLDRYSELFIWDSS